MAFPTATGLISAYMLSGSGVPSTTYASGPPIYASDYAIYQDTATGLMYYWNKSGTPGWSAIGGGGGGTTLLAAVAGTDGTTAVSTNNYVAFGTPWITGTLVTTATQDILVDVDACFSLSEDTVCWLALFRSGTQIFNTGVVYNAQPRNSYNSSNQFKWVDKALAAGSYTYEVRFGTAAGHAVTATLRNAIVTIPAVSLAGTKGGSMMSVSAGANV